MSSPSPSTKPLPTGELEPEPYETNRITDPTLERTLLEFISEEAKAKLDNTAKHHTQTRIEVYESREKLSSLMGVPVAVIANMAIKRIRCPIPSCLGKPVVNTVCEIKKHLGSHLPYELRPCRCSHDGCGYRVYQESNFNAHLNTHSGGKQFTCGLEYQENGETRVCGFHVSTPAKLKLHKAGTWHPRHRTATSAADPISTPRASQAALPPTSASPVASAGTPVDDRDPSLSPISSSFFGQPTSPASTGATSLPPSVSPVPSSKALPPGTYAGGLTGCLSLHRRDFRSFVYHGHAPRTSYKYRRY